MIASCLSKYMVTMMVILLVLGSHSTVEAVRRDEIKALVIGAKFAETILRANMNSCATCVVMCASSCKSCTIFTTGI